MQIVAKFTNDLKPYDKNPRKNDEAVKLVKKSIEEFGFKVPIVIDKDDVIVCGHTRWKAARALRLSQVPCVVADDLSEEQIKAFRLADNKVGEIAEWDIDLLKVELDELDELGVNMEDFGFVDLDFGDDAVAEEDDFDADAAVEEIKEPITKVGDIWKLGNHRLICGDSTDKETVSKLLNSEKADMVFTDPPYGVSYEGGLNEKKKAQIKNDALRGDKLYDFLHDVFLNLKLHTKAKSAIYVFYAHSNTRQFVNAFHDVGLKQRSIIIWHKTRGGFGDFMAQYMNAYEPCIYGSNGESVNWYGATNEKTVWSMDKEKKCDLHPTMKPIAVVARAINNSSRKGDAVLDLFGGSGSTLIACEQLNRVCYMCELDPKYCDVIVKRWETLTGKKAERITGE